jgi:hypothetical protein
MRTLTTLLRVYKPTRPALWMGVPLSLVVGLSLYVVTASSIEADSRERFAGLAQNARSTIAARIKSYTD